MQKNKNIDVKNLTRLALVAAAYVALTLVSSALGLGYGPVQFRVSEVLVLLCFYRKDYAPALIVGCLIANFFSPFGLYDIIFGTLATAVGVIPMYYMKNIYLSALLPIVSNGVIVGIELYLCGDPLFVSMAFVALGELAVIGILGIAIFKLVIDRNPYMLKLIGSTRKTSSDNNTAKV